MGCGLFLHRSRRIHLHNHWKVDARLHPPAVIISFNEAPFAEPAEADAPLVEPAPNLLMPMPHSINTSLTHRLAVWVDIALYVEVGRFPVLPG